MKKIVIYILGIIGICFFIPIFFTTRFMTKEVLAKNENMEVDIVKDIEKYEYSDFETIKLLHKSTGIVEEKKLDDYIAEVVSSEMPIDYELEALKAQAVAARTYTIYRMVHGAKHEEADMCDDYTCCQAWISKEDRIEMWKDKRK